MVVRELRAKIDRRLMLYREIHRVGNETELVSAIVKRLGLGNRPDDTDVRS